MKRFTLCLAIVLASALYGCTNKNAAVSDAMPVIFDTDLGNDVDDAMAMDILFKYMDAGSVNLLGIMINKVEDGATEYADILRTWYGYPDIPIGVIKTGADCSTDAVNYAKAVADLKNDDGTPMFSRSINDYSELPLAVDLYREILASQPDSSVTVISTGFSTNLARLLDTPADGFSDLTGNELVARKVKRLVTMAGCIVDSTYSEYNIVRDIPSARKVFSQWPGPIVTSPFEVGKAIKYPGSSIENDFSWASKHPMVEAYKVYLPMPYDRPTWDLTSVLYAVEGEGSGTASYFDVAGPGRIEITGKGCSVFSDESSADRSFLTVDSLQQANVLARFKVLLTSAPVYQSKVAAR